MKAVIVTGGREYANPKVVADTLSVLNFAVLVHGCCTGADRLAAAWAADAGKQVVGAPADWKQHGRAAGPIRNEHMIERTIECFGKGNVRVAAFPGSRGTKNCVALARKAGVRVMKVPTRA